MFRRVCSLLAAAVVVSACTPLRAPWPVTYKPRWHTALRPAPSTASAVLFYPGDAKLIDAADSVFLGRLFEHGGSDAREAHFERTAQDTGAKNGGTHVILVAERAEEREVGASGGMTSASCYAATCWAATSPVRVLTETRKERVFAVFAVPRESWEKLPLPLRPTPLASSEP